MKIKEKVEGDFIIGNNDGPQGEAKGGETV
jgi:hypothetical protein